jgi:chromosomal replication initiation ATPase DnaA
MSYVSQTEVNAALSKARVLGDIKDLKHLKLHLEREVRELRMKIMAEQRELENVRETLIVTIRTKESEQIIRNLNHIGLEPMAIELAARVFGISVDDMHEKNRNKKVILARRFVYVYLRSLSEKKFSYNTLGNIFGQDHATVINAIKKHNNEYGTYKWSNKLYTDMYNAFTDSVNKLAKEKCI